MKLGPIGGFCVMLACDGGGSAAVDAAAPGDAAADTTIPADAAPAIADAPQPSAEAVLLLSGRARLVGARSSACSNQVPATGDRWCAFSLPSRVLGRVELWAIDFSKALAGAVPKCDGTDSGCVLVTDDLWTGRPDDGPVHPFTHRFDGDTLIYHARAGEIRKEYRGPIFAWRPGWPAGRQVSLTSGAYTCAAHPGAEVVVCIENVTTDPAAPIQFDLTAGTLGGARLVTRITPTRPGTQLAQWRAAFSRAGNHFAWSTGGLTATESETIYAAKVADLGMADRVVTIARNATRWAISADDKRIYFLRDYNVTGDPRGTLVAADFPGGGNETAVATAVAGFMVLSAGGVDRGVGFFTNARSGRADFKILPDVSNPSGLISVVSGVTGVLSLSPDLTHVVYAANADAVRIAGTDGSGSGCLLGATPTLDFIGPVFSPGSSLLFWADQVDPGAAGFVASVDCTNKRQFAERTDLWFFAGQSGLVYSDHATGQQATLMRAPLLSTALGASAELQRQVARVHELASGEAVLFTLAGAPADADNTYFLRLPF
jgi:hypothetical protein